MSPFPLCHRHVASVRSTPRQLASARVAAIILGAAGVASTAATFFCLKSCVGRRASSLAAYALGRHAAVAHNKFVPRQSSWARSAFRDHRRYAHALRPLQALRSDADWISLPVADVRFDEQGLVSIKVALPLERNFDRPRDELLETTLNRVAKSLTKKKKSARRRIRDQAVRRATVEQPPVKLLDFDSSPLDGSLTLLAVFSLGQAAALAIGAQRYRVRVNRPMVVSADCQGRPVVGMPLMPFAEGNSCSMEDMRWEWQRSEDGAVLSRERRYLPTAADLGFHLTVVVRPPGADGSEAQVWGSDEEDAAAQHSFQDTVKALPSDLACSDSRSRALQERREEWLQAEAAASEAAIFRVVSYNTLADAYRHCWDQMFPYCEPQLYAPKLRLQVARHEVVAYSADIICLQEIDERWFGSYWEPHFVADGYAALFTKKSGDSNEGSATFVRAAAFEVLDFQEIALASCPFPGREKDRLVVQAGLEKLLSASDEFADLWCRLGTVAQLVLLRSRTEPHRLLVVCNTHLYFAGMARHVKVLQAAVILEQADRMVTRAVIELGTKPAVMFCGDLNSEPGTAAMQLLLHGSLSPGHPDWVLGHNFRWGFASSKQAAKQMAAALKDVGPSGTVSQLRPDKAESLRDRLERHRRMRVCWGVLTQGAEASDRDDVGSEDAKESTTSSTGSTQRDFTGLTFHEALEQELRRGATFKTSAVVAAAQLAADADLPCSLSGGSTLDNEAMTAASTAIATLGEVAEVELQSAMARQAALAEHECKADTSADAGSSSGLKASLCGVGLDLKHPFGFASAYAELPEFTNFIGGYEATLDWILFSQSSLRRVAAAPLPSREVVEQSTALPSERFPSDHLLLAADLTWSDP